MKFKLMKLRDRNQYDAPDAPARVWAQAVSIVFSAPDAAAAEKQARAQIMWLTPQDEIRMDPTTGVSLGAQLWEPCKRCGTEPSYAQPGGHLCAKCAQTDHPRIPGPAVPHHAEEPDGAR